MKFIWIFCNESISPEVMELLERLDVEGYTVWKHVLGSHRGCRTHWGDEVWPGTNDVATCRTPRFRSCKSHSKRK
jgi:hypothetical protein